MKRTILLVSIACFTIFTSCNKDDILDNLNPTTTNQASTPPTPTIANSNGTLVAVKSQTITETPLGPSTMNIGIGVAAFYTPDNPNSFLDAGTVTLNANTLAKQTNNSYVLMPGTSNPTGIDFAGGVSWSVGGNGNIAAFTFEPSIEFPTVGSITSSGTVSKSNGYTLTASSVADADSVIFMVGSVVKTVSGNPTSYTFSSSELSSLQNGNSVVQIAAYKIQESTQNTKTYHFIKETVSSKTVTIE
jgi:hypothetical protein